MVIKGYIFLSNKKKIHKDSTHCISVIFSSIFSHCSCLLQLKMICTFWTVIKLQCTKERSGQINAERNLGFDFCCLVAYTHCCRLFDRNFINDVKMLMRNASVETQNRQKISFVGCCVASWRVIFYEIFLCSFLWS